jgi:hypothetical protein
MCEITESESFERRLDSLAAENQVLRFENAQLDAIWRDVNRERCSLRAEVERLRERARQLVIERDAALLGLGRVLSGADAVDPPAGELTACARRFLRLDAEPAGVEGGIR